MSDVTREKATAGRSWEARPGAARAIRTVVLLGPISVGCAAAIAANDVIGAGTGVAFALARSLAVVVVSTAVVWAVDRYARKLLPLAALMQLSLVFPDRAPSRFRSALKSGSSRRLERTLEETRRNGLADDPGDAARQVVQLIGAVGDHDRRTRGHSERVRLYADLIGEELKLPKEERQKLQWGALLHDLGKLMVPDEILNKDGRPTFDEWTILKGHPDAGMRLIEPMREFLGEWVHAIGGHHEKWDGSGYPAGLRGRQIPTAAAVVAVADSFEVMTAVRSYKKAMPLADARAELTRCAGTHFCPDVVRAFLSISLGRLRIVAGPLAALAHLPFLGKLAQLPAAAAAVPTMVGSAVVPAAAVVTAASLAMAPTPAVATQAAADDRPVAFATTTGAAPTSAAAHEPAGGTDESTASPAPDAAMAGTTDDSGTTVATPPEVTTVPTTTPRAATTTAPLASTTSKAETTTTVAAVATTAPAPPAASVTSAPTTVAAPAPVPGSFAVRAGYDPFKVFADSLDGKRVPRGTPVYVWVELSSATRVDFMYPGGTHSETSAPWDLAGTGSFGLPVAWTVPWTPGTYSVTAVAWCDDGVRRTVTARFTVT